MLKNNIDFISKMVCLVTYIIVIIFLNSLLSFIILGLYFLFLVIKNKDLVLSGFMLLMIVALIISYFTNTNWLIKIALLFSYGYYFIYTPTIIKKDYLEDNNYQLKLKEKRLKDLDKKGVIIDKNIINSINEKSSLDASRKVHNDYLRFTKKKYSINNSFYMYYVTVHLFVLLISIMLG